MKELAPAYPGGKKSGPPQVFGVREPATHQPGENRTDARDIEENHFCKRCMGPTPHYAVRSRGPAANRPGAGNPRELVDAGHLGQDRLLVDIGGQLRNDPTVAHHENSIR